MLPIPFPPRQPGFPHGRVRSETRWKRKFPFQSEVTKARLLICRRFAALPTFLSVSRCEGSRVARGDKDMVSFRVTKNAYASELAHLLAVLACLRYVSQSPPSLHPSMPSFFPSFVLGNCRVAKSSPTFAREILSTNERRNSPSSPATMTTTNTLRHYAAAAAAPGRERDGSYFAVVGGRVALFADRDRRFHGRVNIIRPFE